MAIQTAVLLSLPSFLDRWTTHIASLRRWRGLFTAAWQQKQWRTAGKDRWRRERPL